MNVCSIDESIEEFNKIGEEAKKAQDVNSRKFMTLFMKYNTMFFEILDALSKMQDSDEIIAEPEKKPISYLREILKNNGPEYCYTICFRLKENAKKQYKIGVCVRGWPIIKAL